MTPTEKDFLTPENRAEDILLGSLGFGEEAKLVSVTATADGYEGVARWPDGEEFSFKSEDPLDDLQRWALQVINKQSHPEKAAR